MKRPSKAVVLAAGFGTRMDPLSRVRPKALMPFWGKPLLDHTLDLLASWGVNDVVINLHHAPSAIVSHCVRRTGACPRINLSFEPEILGTGGALRRADWFFHDDPLWIVNADVVADLSPTAFLHAYNRHRPAGVLWLESTQGPLTVEATDNRVTCFRSPHPGGPGTFTFCGVQLVSPLLLRRLPASGFLTLVDLYEAAMRRSEDVLGVCVPRSFWADVGTPQTYLDAHARALEAYRRNLPGKRLVHPARAAGAHRLRRKGVMVDGFAAIGAGASVAAGARLENAVVWDGATVTRRADIRNAILADDVRIGFPVQGMAVRADAAADPTLISVLQRLRWREGNTVLLPLEPRGSDRTFTRIRSGQRRAIVVRYGTERPENEMYADHARFLARLRVPAPRVLLDLPEKRLCVMEDLGGETLLGAAGRGFTPRVARLYAEVIEAAARLHRRGQAAATSANLRINPPFGRQLFRWEHDLFRTHLLPLYRRIPKALTTEVMHELGAISRRLQREPQVLLHRDLQSSNVLIVKGHPVLIDFQGMRRGPAVYDLASLLYDPYVSPPERLRERLLDEYAGHSGRSTEDIASSLCYGAAQRLIQALGAYGRLGSTPGTRRFLQHIPPALEILEGILTNLDKCTYLRELVTKLREVRL